MFCLLCVSVVGRLVFCVFDFSLILLQGFWFLAWLSIIRTWLAFLLIRVCFRRVSALSVAKRGFLEPGEVEGPVEQTPSPVTNPTPPPADSSPLTTPESNSATGVGQTLSEAEKQQQEDVVAGEPLAASNLPKQNSLPQPQTIQFYDTKYQAFPNRPFPFPFLPSHLSCLCFCCCYSCLSCSSSAFSSILSLCCSGCCSG
jgi:hypothetical protein